MTPGLGAASSTKRAPVKAPQQRKSNLNEPWREEASSGKRSTGPALLAARPPAANVGLCIRQRCAKEWDRPPIYWAPSPGAWKDAVGIFYGLRFPWTERTIKWLGPPWLTKAFQAAGTLTSDGEVSNLVSVRSLGARGAAERLLLTVEYGAGQVGMHTKLLAKVPLEDSERLGRKRSERDSPLLVPVGPLPQLKPADYFAEINFYRLHEANSPMRMPKFYYGDISDRTSRFILITEWVPLPGETDDARQGEVEQLYAGEPTATLDEHFASVDEHCYLVGPHADKCLGVSANGAYLQMSAQRDTSTTWTLRAENQERSRHMLIAPNGLFLAVHDAGERALHLTATADEKALWSLIHATGERHKCFFRSSFGTHLACLNDAGQTLYMSSNMDDWEKWRRVPAESDEGADAILEHLELRGANLEVCKELVEAGAAFAAGHKARRLGPPAEVQQAFQRHGPELAELWEPDADWKGLGDTAFIEKAAQAQEFIIKIGAALFPEGVVTPATMKGYRAMLVTTRANLRYIRWWCHSQADYVVFGHDRLDMDSAFRWCEQQRGRPALHLGGMGFRDWESVSIGPVGAKLWNWLRFAESDVLANCRDELLGYFIAVHRRCGGPELQLEDLRTHFLLAAALESVELLSCVPEIYRCWPKNQWFSIKGLRDTRLLGQTLGQQSLWLCLKSLVNIALVLSTCDMVELLSQVMPLIFHTAAHASPPGGSAGGSAGGGGADGAGAEEEQLLTRGAGVEVRADPSRGSALVARFPEALAVLTTGRRQSSSGTTFAEIKLPVHGWVDVASLELATSALQAPAKDRTAATAAIFERMYHTRRQYTGSSPLGMSAISTMKLNDTLRMYDRMFQCLQRFGRGECQMVTGGFLVEERRRRWWPKGYQDWAHHTFLVFDDGTIADVTADQFDDGLPQLWWPADAARYTFDSSKPDESECMRQHMGIKRWTEYMERDSKVASRPLRNRWWVENVSPQLPDSMRAARHGKGKAAKAKPAPEVPSQSQLLVMRHGHALDVLPPVSYEVEMGDGRAAAVFRRLTGEGELGVWLVENVFHMEELQELVNLCDRRNGFQPSLQNTSTGQHVKDGRRTSLSCSLHWPLLWGGNLEAARGRGAPADVQEELAAAQHVTDLCARALKADASRIEPLQLVKYTPGQYYGRHMDTHKEPDRLSSHNGEQRTHTLLVFLNDVPPEDGGGFLHFPLIELRVLPRAGFAVLWQNVRGPANEPDPNSLHEGEPILSSEKIAMNVWLVDRPFTVESVVEGRQRKLAQSHGLAAKKPQGQVPLLLRKLREWADDSDDSSDGPRPALTLMQPQGLGSAAADDAAIIPENFGEDRLVDACNGHVGQVVLGKAVPGPGSSSAIPGEMDLEGVAAAASPVEDGGAGTPAFVAPGLVNTGADERREEDITASALAVPVPHVQDEITYTHVQGGSSVHGEAAETRGGVLLEQVEALVVRDGQPPAEVADGETLHADVGVGAGHDVIADQLQHLRLPKDGLHCDDDESPPGAFPAHGEAGGSHGGALPEYVRGLEVKSGKPPAEDKAREEDVDEQTAFATHDESAELLPRMQLSGDWLYYDDAGSPPGEVMIRIQEGESSVSAQAFSGGVITGATFSAYRWVQDLGRSCLVLHEEADTISNDYVFDIGSDGDELQGSWTCSSTGTTGVKVFHEKEHGKCRLRRCPAPVQ